MIKRVVRAKQFKLPLEERLLEDIYNRDGVEILIETVFQDKPGDVVVFLKWEQNEERRPEFFA